MVTRTSSLVRGVAIAVGLIAATGGAANAQTLINLGTLPGHAVSWGSATNSNGNVVVGSSQLPSGGAFRAYRWVHGVGMQDLGVGSGMYVMNTSNGYGVSADGSVVSGMTGYYFGYPIASFRWTSATGMVVTDPTFNPIDQRCYYMSGNGQWLLGKNMNTNAIRWSSATGYQQLGTFGSYTFTGASDASFDGSVVVGHTGNGGPAWRWTQAGGMVQLPLLPNCTKANATAVTSDGNTAVGFTFGNTTPTKAFRWTNGPGTIDLGTTPGFVNNSASDVSDDGLRVVGQASPTMTNTNYDRSATIWTPYTGKPRSLNWLLPIIGVNTTGWHLHECNAISRDGRVLVGTGMFNGQVRAWTLRDLDCFAPIFDPDVPSTSTACAGATAYLQVAGISLGSYSVQWYRNNVPISNGLSGNGSMYFGTTTTTLTIGNVQTADAGIYTVRLLNACNARFQSNTLVVNTIPQITQQPTNALACGEGPGVFNVQYSSPLTTTLQWQVQFSNAGPWYYLNDGPWLDQFANILFWANGTATSQLSISQINPNVANNMTFRCILQNNCGAVPTIPATLTKSQVPSIDALPGSQTVCIGGSTSYTLTTFTNPANFQWYIRTPANPTWVPLANGWYIDWVNSTFMFASGVTSATLNLSSVYLGSQPNVEVVCSLWNDCGAPRFQMPEVQLSHEPPLTLFSSPADGRACPAGFVTVNASANGNYFTEQWEYYNTGTSLWTALYDGVYTEPVTGRQYTVSGAQTSSMTLSTFSFNTFPDLIVVRYVATGLCNSVVSNTADLTIGPTCDFNEDASGDSTDVIDLANAIASNVNPYGQGCDDFNLDGIADFSDVVDLSNAISSATCP